MVESHNMKRVGFPSNIKHSSPVNDTCSYLLSDHEERICLAVCCGVCAEVMDIHTINNLGLWPVVMDEHLDPVRHVVGHGAVLQDHQAPGGVDIEAVASVPGDVGIANCDNAIRLGDIYS